MSAGSFSAQLARIRSQSAGMALPGAAGGGRNAGGNRRGTGGLHGGNIHLGPGGVGLGAVSMAAGDLFWPLAAGGAAVYGGHSLYESAKDMDTERAKFRLYGMSAAQNSEAFGFVDGMRQYGTSRTENMKSFREAQGVFRESGLSGSAALEGAKLAAPILAKLDFLSSSLDDESRARMGTANLDMLRYVESSGGLKSAAEFNRIADFGYKMNASSGGNINWAQLRQFKARAGASGFNLTDDAMARLEPIIGEMKGGATGFGLSTAFNRLNGVVHIAPQIGRELVDAGVWEKSKVVFNKEGGVKRIIGNPLGAKNADLLATNPELFYEQVIRPMYAKMNASQSEIARQNVLIFGRTGGANMSLVEKALPVIAASIKALEQQKGIGAASNLAKGTLSGQQKEFEAAWSDFKLNFGEKMLPFFTEVLQIGSLILRAFPDATKSTSMGDRLIDALPGGPIARIGLNLARGMARRSAEAREEPQPVVVNVTNKVSAAGLTTLVEREMGIRASKSATGVQGFDFSRAPDLAGGYGINP